MASPSDSTSEGLTARQQAVLDAVLGLMVEKGAQLTMTAVARRDRLPLRIMRVGIDFIIAGGKDTGILLTLTNPEREILKQAFGLSD